MTLLLCIATIALFLKKSTRSSHDFATFQPKFSQCDNRKCMYEKSPIHYFQSQVCLHRKSSKLKKGRFYFGHNSFWSYSVLSTFQKWHILKPFNHDGFKKGTILGVDTKTSKENSNIGFPCVDIRLPDWMRDDSLDLFCDARNNSILLL